MKTTEYSCYKAGKDAHMDSKSWLNANMLQHFSISTYIPNISIICL